MKIKKVSKTVLAEERTLLAAERTFSAWLRTALAAMAGGLAIIRLIEFKTEWHRIAAYIIGGTLVAWGVVIIVFASADYKKIRDELTAAKSYKSSVWGFWIIVIPLLVMSALLILVTLP